MNRVENFQLHNLLRYILYLQLFLWFSGCSAMMEHVSSNVLLHNQNLLWYGNMAIQPGKTSPNVYFVEPDVVTAYEEKHVAAKVLGNVATGTVEGAKTGASIGLGYICAPTLRVTLHGGKHTGLVGLLICGGAVAGGGSIGAVVGGLSGTFVGEVSALSLRQSFAAENTYESLKSVLLQVDPEKTDKATCRRDGEVGRWSLESEGRPIESTLKINIVEVGLFSVSRTNGTDYKLMLKLNPVLTDLNDQTLASQNIDIVHSAHTYEEWVEYETRLLKTALNDIYETAAELIIRELVMGCEAMSNEAA